MNAPSRDFMVRQAVLNAAAKRYPWTLERLGIRTAVERMMSMGDWLSPIVVEWVTEEYRVIAAQYSRAA